MSGSRTMRVLAAAVIFLLFTVSESPAQQDGLAIFNLRSTNIDAMGYNGDILYALITALDGQKNVNLMSRRQMEEILFQEGLVQGDSPELALKAGKALGIKFVLFGRVKKEGEQLIVQLNLMDIPNNRVVKTWDEIFSGREAISAQIPPLAADVSRMLGQAGEAAPRGAPMIQAPEKEYITQLKAQSKGHTVQLTWIPAQGMPIKTFNVYRADHSEAPRQLLGRTETGGYVDVKITQGRSYLYQIGIVLASGREVKSARTVEIRNAGQKSPYPPLILSSAGYVRRTEIKFVQSLLNEQEGFRIDRYNIFRRTGEDGQWRNIHAFKAGRGSSFDLTMVFEDVEGLADGTTYEYAISSLDKNGLESPMSDPVSIRTAGRTAVQLAQNDLLRKIDVTWKPIQNVKGYYFYRKNGGAEWQKVGKIKGGEKTRYVDEKDLEDGQDYVCYITGYDDKGETGPSNEISCKTKMLPPFPVGVEAEGGRVKAVLVSWTPMDDPDVGGYSVYRGTDERNLERIATVKDRGTMTYLDKRSSFNEIGDGKTYYYGIAAFNLFRAEGERSPVVHAMTKPRPAAPRGIAVTTGQASILVKWERNPETDIRVNTLYRSRNGGRWSTLQEVDPGQTEYRDLELDPDTEYRYRLIAEDRDGLKSDPADSRPIASPLSGETE